MKRKDNKRKKSSTSAPEKFVKSSHNLVPQSQFSRGDSLAEEYSNVAVDKLGKRLEKS